MMMKNDIMVGDTLLVATRYWDLVWEYNPA